MCFWVVCQILRGCDFSGFYGASLWIVRIRMCWALWDFFFVQVLYSMAFMNISVLLWADHDRRDERPDVKPLGSKRDHPGETSNPPSGLHRRKIRRKQKKTSAIIWYIMREYYQKVRSIHQDFFVMRIMWKMSYLDNIPIYQQIKKSVIYSNRGNWVNLRYWFHISGLAWLIYIENISKNQSTKDMPYVSHSPP